MASGFGLLCVIDCQGRVIRQRILHHLFMRKLAGEEVWLQSLATAVSLPDDAVAEQLALCKIPVLGSKERRLIRVPGPKVLKDLLLDDGFDDDLLEPIMAERLGKNGSVEMQLLKWLEQPVVDHDTGCVTFRATWAGKHEPSNVCCHELNKSARHYVCVSFCCVLVVVAHFCL
jgi:hypothetical protein